MVRIVGAGLSRTGTMSLWAALPTLLGGPCYHGAEFTRHMEEHLPVWQDALDGKRPAWSKLFPPYVGTVDLPAALFWRELHAQFPDAFVLLSTRKTAEQWWESMNETVLELILRRPLPGVLDTVWRPFAIAHLKERFTPELTRREAVIAAYERHNAEVRATVPASRLIEWQPGDGWGPICKALGVAEPAEPFPQINARAEWKDLVGQFGVDW